MRFVMLTAAIMSVWSLGLVLGAESEGRTGDEAAIRQAVERYVAAFNAGDGKALAGLWTPEAVYTNPLSGVEVTGREAIALQFSNIFAEQKEVKLEATTESIRFISPGVAVEHGTAIRVSRSNDIL